MPAGLPRSSPRGGGLAGGCASRAASASRDRAMAETEASNASWLASAALAARGDRGEGSAGQRRDHAGAKGRPTRAAARRQPARDHPGEDLDRDRRAGAGRSKGQMPTPARLSSARNGIPRIDCSPTVPLPPGVEGGAGPGRRGVRRPLGEPEALAPVEAGRDQRPDPGSPERPRELARRQDGQPRGVSPGVLRAGQPALVQVPARPREGEVEADDRGRLGGDGLQDGGDRLAAVAPALQRQQAAGARDRGPDRPPLPRAVRPSRPVDRDRLAERAGPGYPIPTDWACWSFLPSLLRAGATITSHFWKLWIESYPQVAIALRRPPIRLSVPSFS